MAFSAITARGSLTEKVSDTTIAVSPSANLTVGKVVVVVCTTDNDSTATSDGASTRHSLADSQGNTWTKAAEYTDSDGAAADGVTHSVWWAVITTQIGTGNTITLTTSSAVTNKIISIFEATKASTSTIAKETVGVGQGAISASVSSLPLREYLLVGAGGSEGNDNTKTADADYTERFDLRTGSGTAATEVAQHVQTRIAKVTSDTCTSTTWTNTNPIFLLVPLYEVFPAISSLTDNFDDNSVDGAKWYQYTAGSGTIAEASSQIELSVHATTLNSECDLGSNNRYNLVGSSFVVNLKQAAHDYVNTALTLQDSGGNRLSWLHDGSSTLYATWDVAYEWQGTTPSVSFTPGTDAYLRIRESGGTIYWDYSTDRGQTWTNLRSELVTTITFPVTALEITLNNYKYSATSTSQVKSIFDNVNIIPVQTPVTKSLKYTVKKAVSATKSLKYCARKAVGITKSLTYAIDSSAMSYSITKSLAYKVVSKGSVGYQAIAKKAPSTADQWDDYTGSYSWTDLANALVPSDGRAYSTIVTATKHSYTLLASDFGYSIPSTAVVDRVLITVRGYVSGTGVTGEVGMWDGGGTATVPFDTELPVGSEGVAVLDATPSEFGYGSFPASMVNSGIDFGVTLGFVSSEANRTIYISSIEMVVFYKAASPLVRSLQYLVKKSVSATKSLTYRVRKVIGVTKSLTYKVKQPESSTKSLKYTIKRAATPVTKSLVYRIVTTPAEQTKSLTYRVRKAISVTKSLKYATKKAFSITKSLAYRLTLEVPILKTLTYTVKAPKSTTKQLSYRIVTTHTPVTKSLRYAIVRTQAAIQKVVAYFVVKGHSTTKSLVYRVRKPISATKSLKYSVFSKVPVTKSLKYCVSVTQSAITKSLTYSLAGASIKVTKSLSYSVRTSHAITKSLKYAVDSVQSAITKTVRYAVKKTYSVTKSLRYVVLSDHAVTKSLRYGVLTKIGLSKSVTYRIVKGVPITKSLRYELLSDHAITKQLKYCVVTTVSSDPVLQDSYGDAADQSLVVYASRPMVGQRFTPSSSYNLVRGDLMIRRQGSPVGTVYGRLYNGVTLVAESTNSYDVSTITTGLGSYYSFAFADVPLSSGTAYTLVVYFDGGDGVNHVQLRYKGTGTHPGTLRYYQGGSWNSLGGSDDALFAVYSAAPMPQKTLRYYVLRSIPSTKSLTYYVKKAHAITKSLAYLVRKSNSITKSLAYVVLSDHAVTKSLKYTVLKPQTTQKSLRYLVRKFVTITKSLTYIVAVPTALTKSLKYTVKSHRTITKSLRYDVFYSDYFPYEPDVYSVADQYTNGDEGYSARDDYTPL